MGAVRRPSIRGGVHSPALDYLQALHDEFNGGLAAGDRGRTTSARPGVERAIAYNASVGRPTDFVASEPARGNRAYVPKLLAMKRLMAEP